MQLHTILKFGSFVVLLDLLKILQDLFVQMSEIFTVYFLWGSHTSTVSITAELVMEPNCMCLLLTPLLLPLIIWLAENVNSVEKKFAFHF